ncbi:MAG TPA: YdcF family protein [Candidatus Angelobacter sp.]|nr:YdcF family protein [Candidatus Angelobacter sp.]
MAARSRKTWLLWLLLAILFYVAAVYRGILAQAGMDEARPADAIVVFGAAEYVGHPSPVYKARLDHAAQLYHRGLAGIVITTGGPGDAKFNEGIVGREYLKTLGIPDSQLIAETQSSDTAQSARRVATIMRENGLKTCVAVSDSYHIFRIKKMLGREGITVFGSPRPNSTPPTFWKREEYALHEIGSYTIWLFHLS